MTQKSTKPTSQSFNHLLKAATAEEIMQALITCCWEALGNDGEPPPLTSIRYALPSELDHQGSIRGALDRDLNRWQSETYSHLFDCFRAIGLDVRKVALAEWEQMDVKDGDAPEIYDEKMQKLDEAVYFVFDQEKLLFSENPDWIARLLEENNFLTMDSDEIYNRHKNLIAKYSESQRKCADFDHLYFDLSSLIHYTTQHYTTHSRTNKIAPQTVIPTYLRITAEKMESLHRFWKFCRQIDNSLKHPLAPITKTWLQDRTAKYITREYDHKHPVAIIDRASMGSIRDVIVPSTANWREELGSLKGVSASPPNSEQIEIPGLETQSYLPVVLPLQAVHIVDGLETTKRGAVAMPIRLLFESIMALEPRETTADIRFRLGDLLRYLNPDRKYNRTNHLPYVLKGLHSLYFLRIPYRENPDKPTTEVDWIPVLPRTVPNLQSGDEASIILEVKLPPDAISGMIVEKEIVRLTGKQSSPKLNAYLAACGIFDKYGTTGKAIIDPTRPVEVRDSDGYLVDTLGQRIYDNQGKPIKDLYHPIAVKLLDRESNPNRTKYPILSFDELTRACFPKGFEHRKKATYRKRALTAWEGLEAEDVIVIERFGNGWRIMPGTSHIRRYRALKQVY